MEGGTQVTYNSNDTHPMQVCERQAGTRSMHIQYSYNSNVSILLVSLLSRASGSLRTTPFHILVFHIIFFIIIVTRS